MASTAPATATGTRRLRASVGLSFAALIVLGFSGGATGVLIPSQQADYHVDKATIGILFFTFSAGYVLSGIVNGLLIRILGARGQLTVGGAVVAVGSVCTALRPPFVLLALLSVVLGAGIGILDAGYNAFVAHLPNPTSLLNLLHACYGVGALVGPLVAAFLLHAGLDWPAFYWVLAPCGALLAAGSAALLPGRVTAAHEPGAPVSVRQALRRPAVWLGAAFLFGYVGVEVTVGNWGYSFLTQHVGQGALLAGWVVSGYWLGLTIGRFVVGTVALRLGLGTAGMMYAMVGGLCVCAALLWAIPGSVAAALLLLVMGMFLGPMFPTVIAVQPRLVPVSLVPTSIGLLMGVSVVGGSALPWGAGTLAQHVGLGSFPPYLLVLGVLCLLGWWGIARRMAPEPTADRAADESAVAASAESVARTGFPTIE